MMRLEGVDRLVLKFDRWRDTAPDLAAKMCGAVGEHVKSVMVETKLNGQNIGRVDDVLIGSWSVRSFQTPRPGAVLSTDTPYARAQEYGAKQVVSTPAHNRRKPFKAFGLTQRTYKAAAASQRRKFTAARTKYQESSAGAFSVSVRKHSRRMNLRPRHFLRDAVNDSKGDVKRIMLFVWRSENG